MFAHLPIETDRLILRPWRPEDLEPFAELNADPEVMAYFPAVLSRQESDATAARVRQGIDRVGYGFFAVEVKEGPSFVGMIGINVPSYSAWMPCGPCLEVGWRLSRTAWGKGYASEGARACLGLGFQVLQVTRIHSFTTVGNTRSRAVMQRIGMERDPSADFDHPMVAADSPVARHVLYHIDRETWAARHL